MAKLVELNREYWPTGGYGHWCPACNSGHEINVEPDRRGVKWSFDGNKQRPTFHPSINLRWGNKVSDPEWAGKGDIGGICHYFITNGQIIYCGDCTHAMAGQTVDLPDIPAGKYISCKPCE